MATTKQKSTELFAFKRLILVIGISILCFGLGMRVFLRFNGNRPEYKLFQDDRMHGQIVRSDGTTESFQGHTFSAVHKGDTLTIVIDEPSENPYGIGADLSFFVNSSKVNVFCGDDQIYTQDTALIEKGIMPCNQFYVVSLPPDYAEKSITIEITPVDRASFTSFSAWLSPGGHVSKNLLTGKESAFLLLMAMLVLTGFASILMTVLSILRRKFNPMTLLAYFCFSIILWNTGSQGFLYILSDSIFAGQGEYLALFAACIPLSWYMVIHIQDKVTRTLMKGFAIFFTVFFIYATILNFSPVPASYSTVLMPLHAAILLMMLTYFVSIVRDRGQKRSFSQQIAEYGFRICIGIGMLEFMRFNFVNNFGTSIPFLRSSLGPLAIAELVLTMILSAGYSYASDLMEKVEKEQLRRLAYQDNLTGIPNRSACYVQLDNLVKEKITDYTMLFLDLNFLKKANDTFGHDIGDKMLKLAAEAMTTAFENRGFYGRWGGDEFIACISGDKTKGDEAVEAFRKAVETINQRETDLPYGLSIAVGRTDSTADAPMEPIEALNAADDRMYLDKKRMKAERVD